MLSFLTVILLSWTASGAEKVRPQSASPLSWGGEIGYILRTDLADTVKPRLYSHSLSLGYGFQHRPSQVSWAVAIEAGYESAGERNSEILVDENRAELFVNDVALAVQKKLAGPGRSRIDLTLANSFPTSPEARREGYSSVTGVAARWNVGLIPNRFSVTFGSQLHYIWNSYEYSPTTGLLNQQGGWKFEASANWTIYAGWFARASTGAQFSRYLDGTNDLNYRNMLATGYAWPRFSLMLSAMNGTYQDREDAYIWFVDEYRRMVSLNARMTF